MKLEIGHHAIRIIPESVVDEVYLEEKFGLRKKNDGAYARRVNAMGLSCWGYLEIVCGLQGQQKEEA